MGATAPLPALLPAHAQAGEQVWLEKAYYYVMDEPTGPSNRLREAKQRQGRQTGKKSNGDMVKGGYVNSPIDSSLGHLTRTRAPTGGSASRFHRRQHRVDETGALVPLTHDELLDVLRGLRRVYPTDLVVAE